MTDIPLKPIFHAFNPHAAVRVYHRNLPHWRQDGATYFVTFRLGDSIPKPVLLKWREEDQLWMKAKGLLYGPEDRSTGNSHTWPKKLGKEYARRTARRMHIELDQCHGCCLFRSPEPRKLIAGAFEYFQGERWWLGDYVVMPNHVHLLLQPFRTNGPEDRSTYLENCLASVKGYVSSRLTKSGYKTGRLWQQDNYDRLVRNTEELRVWRKYIRDNPRKAGLKAQEYTLFECTWL